MPMDGLTLGFAVREVDARIAGGRVDKITQPERDMVILLIPLSILCARGYFVLFRLDEFLGRPLLTWLAVWEGGIAIYGGIIGGILAIFLVCRHKKIPFLLLP